MRPLDVARALVAPWRLTGRLAALERRIDQHEALIRELYLGPIEQPTREHNR